MIGLRSVDFDVEVADHHPGVGAFQVFLTTGTTMIQAGFESDAEDAVDRGGQDRQKMPVGNPDSGPVRPSDGVMPAPPAMVTPLEVLMSIPQPIS